MTPFEQAGAWHGAHGGDRFSFGEVVEVHALVGVVVVTPEVFLMGRRVCVGWDEARLLDPWEVDLSGDCWHVWLMAGRLRGWQRWVPEPLDWVTMHRRGRLRRVRMEDIGLSL